MAHDEDERGRAIVDHGGGFRAAEQSETLFQISGALSPGSGGEVVLEIVVAGADVRERAQRRGAERSPAEIGVENDAGAVDDRLQASLGAAIERAAQIERRFVRMEESLRVRGGRRDVA